MFVLFLFAVATKQIFYGPKPSHEHDVRVVDLDRGFFFHRVLIDALVTYPEYDGYLWMGDDVFLNYPLVSMADAKAVLVYEPAHGKRDLVV